MRHTQELLNRNQPSVKLQECSIHFYVGGIPTHSIIFELFTLITLVTVVHFYCLLFSHACYLLMVLPCLSALYCLSTFIVFDVLLVHFSSFTNLCCPCVVCENSKIPMFTLLLLITGSHASKWQPIAFVFSITIVIELSCVHDEYRSPAKGNLKREVK